MVAADGHQPFYGEPRGSGFHDRRADGEEEGRRTEDEQGNISTPLQRSRPGSDVHPQSLQTWFRYWETTASWGAKEPWGPLLKGLRDAEAVGPQRLPRWQYWMSLSSDVISNEYNQLYPDKTPAQRTRDIHEQCRIARGLFAALPLDEQEVMQSAAQEAYEKDAEEFKQLQESLLNVSPPMLQSQLRQVALRAYVQISDN